MTEQQRDGSVSTNDLSVLIITLLKGAVYQESDPVAWSSLLNLQPRVRDYIAVLGLELMLDDAEGYAFLRARPELDDEETQKVPRLIARRPLSFPVSLLLALLRKKLAEFDAGGGDTRLVLSLDEIVELVRLFLPESSNETKMIDQIEAHVNKIIDFGFLRRLKPSTASDNFNSVFEVRRIVKAFVDAQWLADFDGRLAAYRAQLSDASEGATDV